MTYQEYFLSQWPNEGVGYMKAGEFHPLENLAVDKLHSFEVDPSFLLDEPELLLHSHTCGFELDARDPREPSYADLQGQINTQIEWGICVVDGETCQEPLCWGNPRNRPALLGREFIFNLQDCLALMQDWYYSEYGIVLPNQARTWDWDDQGKNYMEELYQAWGFEQVDFLEIQRGDLLFYQVRSDVPNHIGIYLGDQKVLSHWFGRLSAEEPIGKWRSYIQFAARYKGQNNDSNG